MSFLEELENNKKKGNTNNKTPKDLWESCFKYFNHFVTILQKDNDAFAMQFNFIFLNLERDCQVTGPFGIIRTQSKDQLRLEIKMLTQINKSIKIKRKNKRSAELLKIKLYKDNIISSIKIDNNKNHFIEIANNIPSTFRLILKNNTDFYVEYTNICSSNERSLRLSIDNINEAYMDQLARYILGQNPSLYTESISDKEISKIREKVAMEKETKKRREAEIQAEINQQEELEKIRVANTLKEKSKRYIISHSDRIKKKVLDKIKDLKSKI
ncbi:MAG: hypothetical protein JKX98_01600 [Alcanivoracaceae bacterium]|nr:hypothetical protein [Alcanivoracaceae bacterium]